MARVRDLSAPVCDSITWQLPGGSWDTHVHVFDPASYPYFPSRAYSPVPALHSQLLDFASSLSRSGEAENIVIVQPSPYGTDNSLILDKLVEHQVEKTPRKVRAIAVIDPDNITDTELDRMHQLGVRGIRVNTEATGDKVDYGKVQAQIQKAAVKISTLENWRCQLYVSGNNWPYLVETIRELPIKVIADHQGGMKGLSALPSNVTDVTQQTGFAELMSLAKAGKLFIKISGFYRSSKLTTGGYDDLEPLIKAFAKEVPDQLIWGSDWPHTGSGANRTEANKDLPENFRIVDNVAVLKNIRKWVGQDVWHKMTVTTPAQVYE
ncbi:hypothetical protein F5883DRAFT_409475 [Diaporthe sp. PMI_573]|nr:hypothetical protein F5883DRAFT_409475 [Diaporthaceae sp. PMI_573]